MAAVSVFCIWHNTNFLGEAAHLLRTGTAGHRLASAPTDRPEAPPAHVAAVADAEIFFGQPSPAQIFASPRLRWVALTTAGYTALDRDDVWHDLRTRGVALTKSSVVFDQPCAEHVLAMMLSQSRQLPAAHDLQRGDRTWPQQALRVRSRLLGGQRVILFGYGSIARVLTRLLAPLGMVIIGVRRKVTGDEPVRTVALSDARLEELLGSADHVVNLLPGSPATNAYFDHRRFAQMKAGAVFYNIGRGTTVDQEALFAALSTGALAAAHLDVTDPEPLPPAHPLWSAPNCFITPHTAGGHHDESVRLVSAFVDNLRRFSAGSPLLDRVI